MEGVLAALATNIPWWMTVAMVGAWLTVVVGIFVVFRSRQRLAHSRRPIVLDRRAGYDEHGADDQGLPERTDAVRELGPGSQAAIPARRRGVREAGR